MPAMSPLMTEGTITRWKIKEGDAFAPGDVLLQIVHLFTTCFRIQLLKLLLPLQESDIAMIDVEAHSPGILGKILVGFQPLPAFSGTGINSDLLSSCRTELPTSQ